MPLKIVKTAPKKPTIADLVDEYGAVKRELSKSDPFTKRAEALRKQILAELGEFDSESERIVEGKFFSLAISAKKRETRVDMPALFKMLGVQKFLKVVTVSLKTLQEHVSGAQVEGLTESQHTGPRTLTPTEKAISRKAA